MRHNTFLTLVSTASRLSTVNVLEKSGTAMMAECTLLSFLGSFLLSSVLWTLIPWSRSPVPEKQRMYTNVDVHGYSNMATVKETKGHGLYRPLGPRLIFQHLNASSLPKVGMEVSLSSFLLLPARSLRSASSWDILPVTPSLLVWVLCENSWCLMSTP